MPLSLQVVEGRSHLKERRADELMPRSVNRLLVEGSFFGHLHQMKLSLLKSLKGIYVC